MYYEKTIQEIRLKTSGVKAEFCEIKKGEVAPISYLLWMCDEVQKMDTASFDAALKAARWMGWVFAHLELHGIWDNNTTRDLVREDRKLGFDKPHHS